MKVEVKPEGTDVPDLVVMAAKVLNFASDVVHEAKYDPIEVEAVLKTAIEMHKDVLSGMSSPSGNA